MLPVKPNIDIGFSPGFNALNTFVTIPDSVKVIGPESLLNTLTFIETKALDKKNINKAFSTEIKLKLEDLDSQINVKPKAVTINIKTEKFTEGTFSIPITIINVPKHLKVNYFPKTINLSFYTGLESFNAISIDDFKVVCDFNEHNSKSSYLTPRLIKAPKTIKSSRLHQQKIEYIISE